MIFVGSVFIYMAGFLFLGVKIFGSYGNIYKKMSNLSQFTVLIVHLLFNREVKYQIHSGSGLA
jgi:hypothetical protein